MTNGPSVIEATRIVSTTGAFRHPVISPIVPQDAPVAAEGGTLVCPAEAFRGGVLSVADDLRRNIPAGDANYLGMLDAADAADAYVAAMGLDLPSEPEARAILPDPACLTNPMVNVDLARAGITTINWATGYRQDFS